MNRNLAIALAFVAIPMFHARSAAAQTARKFPPDSLVNLKVLPKTTSTTQVIGTMRNFTGFLGVRCQYCHVGTEGQPLTSFDFASDEKRSKNVARQMMQMVSEINRRLDSLPGRNTNTLTVTCNTCHRGVARPIPLSALIAEVADVSGVDSAVKAYKSLREQYYGRSAYDFGEESLNGAALRLGQARKFKEALGVVKLNEEYFPKSSTAALYRGNFLLNQGDTTAAATAYREALARDPQNGNASDRLKTIGRPPQGGQGEARK